MYPPAPPLEKHLNKPTRQVEETARAPSLTRHGPCNKYKNNTPRFWSWLVSTTHTRHAQRRVGFHLVCPHIQGQRMSCSALCHMISSGVPVLPPLPRKLTNQLHHTDKLGTAPTGALDGRRRTRPHMAKIRPTKPHDWQACKHVHTTNTSSRHAHWTCIAFFTTPHSTTESLVHTKQHHMRSQDTPYACVCSRHA